MGSFVGGIRHSRWVNFFALLAFFCSILFRFHGAGFYSFCEDVDAEYRQWLAAGLTPAPPEVAFYGMKQLFVADPDGYSICFQQPVASASST